MTCCDSRTRCCSYWRMIQSSLGIFAGLSAGYVFYKNYGALEAAVWAIISGTLIPNDFLCQHLTLNDSPFQLSLLSLPYIWPFSFTKRL